MPIEQHHTKQEYSIEYLVNDKQPVVLIGLPEAFLAWVLLTFHHSNNLN